MLVPQTSVVPTLTPQTVQRTELVPQTYVKKEPVQVTRYVDEITTRKVPVETRRTERKITTRKVPVQVQKPVKRYITKKIPVERVRYERQEMVRKVPVTRQRIETVERVEQYDVQVCRWEQVERDVQVPKVVTRRIPVETTRMVPRTVLMRVPVDVYGNPVQTPRYEAYPSVASYSPTYTSQRPVVISEKSLMEDDSFARREVTTEPLTEERVQSSRPRVEVKEVPGSSRIVFPETELTEETDLVDVTHKPEADLNKEFIGQIKRAEDADETEAQAEVADQQPTLQDTPSKLERRDRPSVPMPNLDPPSEPNVESENDKPTDPLDTE